MNPSTLTDRDAIYLGALLHDVGKFHYRAQKTTAGENHEVLGEYFIREHLGRCKALGDKVETVIKASKRELGKIWRADCIAASEREGQDSNQTRRPLVSIFSRIDIGKSDKPSGIFFNEPLALTEKVQMPSMVKGEVKDWKVADDEIIRQHKTLLDSFHSQIIELREIEEFAPFAKSFFALLEKYTVNICSAGYKSFPDISLFDHSRITAALAVCLEESEGSEEILIIKGDISGIQNFIYNDIQMTEKPAKQLRGRSLFIGLLTDTIANLFIRELNLFDANLFFNGGGHFIILAPNNKKNKEKLEEIENTVNHTLFVKFSGKLALVLASMTTSAAATMQDFETVFAELDNELSIAKQHKWFSVLDEILLQPSDEQEQNKRLFESIGEILPKSQYIIEVISQFRPKGLSSQISFSEFGTYYILCGDEDIEREIGNLKGQGIDKAILWSFKSTDFLIYSSLAKGCDFPLAFGFKFIGSTIPKDDKLNPLDFDAIATTRTESYPLLGVARMDVDSLGAVFALGLRNTNEMERKYSISRIASVSRGLTHFFCGHLNSIAEKHSIYLVYSGGDDVFAVGSWVSIIDFVQEVREEFRRFVCGNDNLSISCGVVFTKPTYPIAKSALLAGDQEKAAKKWDINEPEPKKDGVSIFYRETSWKELSALLTLGDGLLANINADNKKSLPRSLIHTLLTTTQTCFDDKTAKIKPGKVARISYLFARHDAHHHAIVNEESDISELTRQNLMEYHGKMSVLFAKYMLTTDKSKQIQRWKNFTIPASYLLLKTRDTKKNK